MAFEKVIFRTYIIYTLSYFILFTYSFVFEMHECHRNIKKAMQTINVETFNINIFMIQKVILTFSQDVTF